LYGQVPGAEYHDNSHFTFT